MTAFSLFFLGAGCSFDPNGIGSEAPVADAGSPAADALAPTADAAPGPPLCGPNDPDLIACFSFENPATPVDDESKYGNDGTALGVVSVAGPPGHGHAMGFLPGSVASVPDDASLDCTTAITLELWVRPHTLPASGGRAGLLDNNGQYGLFLAPDGTVRCSMSSTVASGPIVAVDTWSHIACRYDGQTVRMYQDGVQRAMVSTSVTLSTGSDDGMRLGMNSPSGDVLDGAIDDVRMWRVARTPEQICAAAGRTVCTP